MAEENKLKKLDESIKEIVAKIEVYFNSLNQMELIAWGLIGFGFIMVILGIIFL